MPLVPIEEVITAGRETRSGAGALNVIGIEHAEAIVAGAEAARSTVGWHRHLFGHELGPAAPLG
jgi:fructose-bisphosphate aldolase, class II